LAEPEVQKYLPSFPH